MYLTFAKWALIIVAVAAALAALIAMINILIGKGNDVTSTFNAISGGGGTPSVPQGGGVMSNVTRSIPGFATGGVFAPNNPMLGVLGDNKTEYEVAAPESMLRETFLDALAQSGWGSSGGGSTATPTTLNLILDGQTFARLFLPYLKGENVRLGIDILNR